MSTPSIATALLPAHHSQYAYAAPTNAYSPTARVYPTSATLPMPQRMNNPYHTYVPASQYPRAQPSPAVSYRGPSHLSAMATSQSTSVLPEPRKKQPNWNEFYKNGVPKEIIVIDDDSPEPERPADTARRPTRQDAAAYQSNASRKRKADQGYEVEYTDSPTYSTNPAKFASSSASYQSGDRTTSLQTITAPTSLESYGSNPAASNSYEDVNARVGQKRKRAQPQKETRAQTKRKQQESVPDAYLDYVPPPKPLKKAADVHVPVIKDTERQKNLKIDDEDGHYIVTPGTKLAERCEFDVFLATLIMLTNC
jgi:dual-specificity kinase